jgi:hypothetical protein
MTTASPASTRLRSYRLPSPPPSRIRDGHVARQRAANASCSLWLRTLASNAAGEDGGWIGQAAYEDDGPEVAIWGRSDRHI